MVKAIGGIFLVPDKSGCIDPAVHDLIGVRSFKGSKCELYTFFGIARSSFPSPLFDGFHTSLYKDGIPSQRLN